MDSFEAEKVIARYRGNAIVVTAMTANFEWSQVSTNPDLDLFFTCAMGKASSVGLGLALALPDKKVIVLDGDGSLLMNLGSLVTISNMATPNLIHFVFENGVYRTTGGQPIPGASKINFAAMARDAGYHNTYELSNLEELTQKIEVILDTAGPTFVSLKITPATQRPPFPMVKTKDIISRFRTALSNT